MTLSSDAPSALPDRDGRLRVAVVGAGPSGFYATLSLLAQDDIDVSVDLFDHLPTPHGLVRYGVAPDHFKIKNVTQVFDRGVARAGDRYRFFGNVTLGEDVAIEDLQARYHAVILSHGAQSDRKLGIPGEDLPGVYAAREFVAWYNSHPDFADARFDLGATRAMVVGIGNVAIDVARILARTPAELEKTDIRAAAVREIADSPIREIDVVARRGPAQAACTPVELREMAHMEAADLVISTRDLELDPLSRSLKEQGGLDSQHMKNLEIMETEARREARPGRTVIRLAFYLSPIEILGDGHVEAVRLRRNTLVLREDGRAAVQATDETEEVPCQVLFRSIGYKVAPLPGVPYDAGWSVTPNDRGQVLTERGGEPVPGLFVAGWAKRGPSGVIGTNKPDGAETAESVLAAYRDGALPEPSEGDVTGLLRDRGVRYVSYEDWKLLDELETQAGQREGRPRVKFVRVSEMLAAIDAARATASGSMPAG